MKQIILLTILFLSISIFGANKYYKEAANFADMVMYDDALKKLDDALNKVENTNEDLIKIYFLKAKIYVGQGKQEQAKNFFLKVLFLDNNFKVGDEVSPKIRIVFDKVKEQFQESLTVKLDPPEIMFTPLNRSDYMERIPITVVISNMNEAREAKIFYRLIGHSRYRESYLVPLGGKTYEGAIPVPTDVPKRDFMIEYYIGVLDFEGNVIGAFPAPNRPMPLTIIFPKGSVGADKASGCSFSLVNSTSLIFLLLLPIAFLTIIRKKYNTI